MTQSGHDRVKQNPKSTALTAAALVAVIIAFALFFQMRAAAKVDSEEPDPLPVATVPVKVQPSYRVTEFFAGRIEAAQRTLISFEQPGLVQTIHVDEGDRVETDQLLAELDRSALLTEQAGLVAQRQRATANVELADITAKRQKTLLKKGHISKQRYDEARLNADAARAQLNEITAALDSVAVALDKSEVRAPFAATIGMRMIDDGAVVGPGTSVLELLADGVTKARVGVSIDAANGVQVGQTKTVRINGTDYPARIESVRPDLSPQTRTVDVVLAIENGAALAYGETVALALERVETQTGFWLPADALIEGRKGLWTVYVVRSEAETQIIRREAVEILHFTADRAFVRGDIADGTPVVAGGVHRVIPGQRVEPLPVMN